MKIGMNMLMWTGDVQEGHFPIFRKLKMIGFDGVEIPVFNVESSKAYRDIGKAARDEGLECTGITMLGTEARNPIAAEALEQQGAVDFLRRAVECTHNLGADLMAGPYYQCLGQFSGTGPTEVELERACEVHRQIAHEAETAGITCAIEPLNRFEAYLINTMAQAADYVKRVGHPAFGAMYDTFHANIEERDPIGAIDTLNASGGLRHVHISENDRGVPGRGHAPLRQTIARLREIGYDGWLTIEAFGQALPELAAATRIWRPLFDDPMDVCIEGIELIKASLNR